MSNFWIAVTVIWFIVALSFICTTIWLIINKFKHKTLKFTWKIPVALLLVDVVILLFMANSTTTEVTEKTASSTNEKMSSSDDNDYTDDDEENDTTDVDSSSSSSTSSVPEESVAALKTADSYVNSSVNLSKAGLYDQLVSEEQFPAEAAQYAIDNVKADWNQIALASAKDYRESIGMSNASIHDQLIDEEKFTSQEADYAIQHIDDK